MWIPVTVSQYPSWTTISTNSTVNNYQNDQFEAPSTVLQTALTPMNSSEMNFVWNYHSYDTNVNEFYANLHFAEVLALPRNITRQFNIYLNDDLWYGPFSPSYLMSGAVYSTSPMSGYALYNYSIVATRNSTLPPLLNAWEVYFPMKITDIPTNQSDGTCYNFACTMFFKILWVWLSVFKTEHICKLLHFGALRSLTTIFFFVNVCC